MSFDIAPIGSDVRSLGRPVEPGIPLKIPLPALLNGMRWCGGPGTGKTRGIALTVVWPHLLYKLPAIVIDPTGSLVATILNKIVQFPAETQHQLWSRIKYVDMAAIDYLVPMPLYERRRDETLFAVANRFPAVLKRQDPDLTAAPILGWNSLYECAIYGGQIATALGQQLDFVADLVSHPWRHQAGLRQAAAAYPELEQAVAYFVSMMDGKSAALRERRTGSFKNKLVPFLADPLLLATFASHQPGIRWTEAMAQGKTVLLDFGGETDRERRQFKLIWCFLSIVEFLKSRGLAGRNKPVLFVIDEISSLTNERGGDNSILGQDLHELVTVWARNVGVKLCFAHQYPSQLESAINHALLQLGTQVIGNVQHPDDALYLARQFHRYEPTLVRKVEPVWMNVQEVVGRELFSSPQVIDERTTEFTAEEQFLLAADTIRTLPKFHFLVRPALNEGNLVGNLRRISMERLDKGLFPDDVTIAEVRRRLRKRDGVSVATLLDEISKRHEQGIAGNPPPENAILKGDGSDAQVPRPLPTEKPSKPQRKAKAEDRASTNSDTWQEDLWQKP